MAPKGTNVCERFLVRAPIPQMSRIDSTPFQVAPSYYGGRECIFMGWLAKHGLQGLLLGYDSVAFCHTLRVVVA